MVPLLREVFVKSAKIDTFLRYKGYKYLVPDLHGTRICMWYSVSSQWHTLLPSDSCAFFIIMNEFASESGQTTRLVYFDFLMFLFILIWNI